MAFLEFRQESDNAPSNGLNMIRFSKFEALRVNPESRSINGFEVEVLPGSGTAIDFNPSAYKYVSIGNVGG
ncbi:MAG: hypothetical protein K9G30_02415 [Parvibaculum sp.]|nr:hypothetical protein [Parvibaculum sp.]